MGVWWSGFVRSRGTLFYISGEGPETSGGERGENFWVFLAFYSDFGRFLDDFWRFYEYFTSILKNLRVFLKNTEILGRIDQEVDFYKGVMEIRFLPSWVLSPISFVKRPNFDDLRSRKNQNWWFPQEIKNLGDFLEEITIFTSNYE